MIRARYNRDNENLEQTNMSLLTSVITRLPMWYCITPGSMSDVVVLKDVLKDVYTIPTANQRLAFDLLDVDYHGRKDTKNKDEKNASEITDVNPETMDGMEENTLSEDC